MDDGVMGNRPLSPSRPKVPEIYCAPRGAASSVSKCLLHFYSDLGLPLPLEETYEETCTVLGLK